MIKNNTTTTKKNNNSNNKNNNQSVNKKKQHHYYVTVKCDLGSGQSNASYDPIQVKDTQDSFDHRKNTSQNVAHITGRGTHHRTWHTSQNVTHITESLENEKDEGQYGQTH